MALQNTLNINGVSLNYWKITGLSMAFVTRIAVINLGGYLSEETSKIQDSYCIPKNFRVTGEKFDKYFYDFALKTRDIRDCAYEYIMGEEEDFKNAINC